MDSNQKLSLSPNKNDHYTSVGKKIGDFFIGFFGIWIGNFILGWIISLIGSGAAIISNYSVGDMLGIVFTVVLFVLNILAVVFCFIKGRRYIGIGIISAFILPLLAFGACFIIFMGT